MNSIWETEIERPRLRAFVSALQRAGLVSALALLTALPSHSYSWYSSASVGPDGTVYGWGVTDVTSSSMYHMAYVWVTLTSPNGRQNGPGYWSAQNSVRGDAMLAFDPNDTGTYQVQSTNQGYCYFCNCLIVNGGSGASVTVPYAAVVLNTVVQGQASCTPGLAGWSRTVTMQLQAQNGSPVAISGINMADQITVGTPNDLGIGNTNTGNHNTDSSGEWPDTYFVCSSACPGSTGQTDAIQSWTWSGAPLAHSNAVVYECGSITSDGR